MNSNIKLYQISFFLFIYWALHIWLKLDLYDFQNNLQINFRLESCLKPVYTISSLHFDCVSPPVKTHKQTLQEEK